MACIVKYKWTKITDVQKSLRSIVQKGISNIDIDNRQESFLIGAINNFKENAPEYSQDNIDTFNRAIQQNDDSIKNLLGENEIDYGTYVYLLKLISSISFGFVIAKSTIKFIYVKIAGFISSKISSQMMPA